MMEEVSTRRFSRRWARAGHSGFREIRESSRQIGARLVIWSESGAGTEVELAVPASMAYVKASDGSRAVPADSGYSAGGRKLVRNDSTSIRVMTVDDHVLLAKGLRH
jgi:hypothetical protein